MKTELPILVFTFFIAFNTISKAQEKSFDKKSWQKKLQIELRKVPGVKVKRIGSSAEIQTKQIDNNVGFTSAYWNTLLTEQPQLFGIIAKDSDNRLVDILGATTQYKTVGSSIEVPGYTLPAGGRFEIVGALGWIKATEKLAKTRASKLPSESVRAAIDTISGATSYISSSLCSQPGYPTKIVLNLTAGFELVFNAKTGSQIEWEMEKVCKRVNK